MQNEEANSPILVDDHSVSQSVNSVIDGRPIVELPTLNNEHVDYLEIFRNQLASSYSVEIIRQLNTVPHNFEDRGPNYFEAPALLLNEALEESAENNIDGLSTHYRFVDSDGFEEEFVLSVRRYIPANAGYHRKSLAEKQLLAEDTWIALNVDRFYLEDDNDGNELWPITFSAVSMSDSEKQIDITFDKDGLVNTSLHGSEPDYSSFNLIFIEPISAKISEKGNLTSNARVNDWSRGEDTGSFGPNDTYFNINTLRLGWTGDGDDASELQMFVKNDDNYNNNFPNKYKYRFDKVIREDPVHGGYYNHTIIAGADSGFPYYIYYEVPDVNYIGIDYHFNYSFFISHVGSNYLEMPADRFPLFNLTQHPGPWRLVLSDDDKDYQKFSRRRQNDHADYVQTYDMSTGFWNSVYTGFTVERKTNGSSDDPILESGTRRITISNAISRADYTGKITAEKSYDVNRIFKYVFSLSGPAIVN